MHGGVSALVCWGNEQGGPAGSQEDRTARESGVLRIASQTQ